MQFRRVTHVNAGNTLTLQSGGDTNLKGVVADGQNAAASEFVNQVFNDPATTRTELSRGGVEFRLPNGQGIRLMQTDHSPAFWTQGNKVNRMARFSIDFVSDMNHEHLMVEIGFNGQRLCVLDKEWGNDCMEIEFLADLYVLPESVRMKFSLAEFLKTLEIARSDLAKCQ